MVHINKDNAVLIYSHTNTNENECMKYNEYYVIHDFLVIN